MPDGGLRSAVLGLENSNLVACANTRDPLRFSAERVDVVRDRGEEDALHLLAVERFDQTLKLGKREVGLLEILASKAVYLKARAGTNFEAISLT